MWEQTLMKNLETYLAFCHNQIPYGQEVRSAIDGLNRAVKLRQIRQSERNLAYLVIQSFPDKKQRDQLLQTLAQIILTIDSKKLLE